MAKTWILDTETKGTGATMVPLERRRPKTGPREPLFVPPKPRPRPAPAPAPRAPRRFKVVDVVTRRPLADDVGMRATLAVLARARRSVDVWVYVWQPGAASWRLLSLDEQRALWERRSASWGRAGHGA